MGRESRVLREVPKHIQTQDQLEDARIREMASRVVDEAHWQHILDACPAQEDRDSLERTIGPILHFRRCQNKECASNEKPVWAPVLLLRTVEGGPTSRAEVGLRVCHVCREKINVEHVLTDELWDRIRAGYWDVGKAWPDRDLTTLTFDALQ